MASETWQRAMAKDAALRERGWLPVMIGLGSPVLWACPTCSALTVEGLIDAHETWHSTDPSVPSSDPKSRA